MPRVVFPSPDIYTPEQKRVAEIALRSARGRIAGPFFAQLLSPTIAEYSHQLGAFLGYRTSLPPRVVELAIVTTAREHGCEYAGSVHRLRARECGVSEEAVRQIEMGTEPDVTTPDERMAWRIAKSLCETSALDDDLFGEGEAAFGPVGMVELVTLVGFYGLVSTTLNVFGASGVPHKA